MDERVAALTRSLTGGEKKRLKSELLRNSCYLHAVTYRTALNPPNHHQHHVYTVFLWESEEEEQDEEDEEGRGGVEEE